MDEKKHVMITVEIDVEPEMEDELNRWYNEEHLPNLLKVPGVVWGKRGANTGPGIKFIAVYEHESIDIQHTQAYKEAVDTEWTRKLRPHYLKFERNVYEVI
ncbi:hypothetical protein ACFLZM_01365 [Thermodesulfobacteriota bacterium]